MYSIEILKEIIKTNQLEKVLLQFIRHPVGVNWRQKYQATEDKLKELNAALKQEEPMEMWFNTGEQFITDTEDVLRLKNIKNHEVVSFCSILHSSDNACLHIPMMNFHPKDSIGIENIINLLKKICNGRHGYLLFSGRYWHYWGDFLLSDQEWIRFNCQFLMPTIFISERYVGHSLYRGYNTLRLTHSTPIKPKIPELIKEI